MNASPEHFGRQFNHARHLYTQKHGVPPRHAYLGDVEWHAFTAYLAMRGIVERGPGNPIYVGVTMLRVNARSWFDLTHERAT